MGQTGQRRDTILKALTEQASVQVSELVKQLNVSAVTIRSDLSALEAQGLALRSHGGATGMIGDPRDSGERTLNSAHTVQEWVGRIRRQIEPFLSFDGENAATMVDNLDWTDGLSVIDFLRDVGKHFPVNRMLARDTVKRRLESGISYTEFSYVLLQSMDFLELHRRHGLDLQFGVTTHHEAEASLNHKMVERARKVIVLADSSKFGFISLHRIVQLDRIHTVITDGDISPQYRDGLRDAGIELLIAE